MTADFVSRHAVEQAGNHPRGRHVGCEQPVDAGKRFRGRVDPFRIIDPDPLRSRTGRQIRDFSRATLSLRHASGDTFLS